MSWELEPAFDAAHRATLENGKHLVYVCPPAGWAVKPLWAALPPATGGTVRTIVMVPEVPDALDLLAGLRGLPDTTPAHVLASPARTDRLLNSGAVRTVLGTPADILDAARRSTLKLDRVTRCVVAWPDMIPPHGVEMVATILGQAKEAQRLILTTDETRITAFLERHARRAPVAVHSRPPDEPGGTAGYAIVPPSGRCRAARALLDTEDPEGALLWDPSGRDRCAALLEYPDVAFAGDPDETAPLVIAVELPSSAVLRAAGGARTVTLIRAAQLPYLRRLAESVTPIRLVTEVDRARDRAFQLRRQIRETISQSAWGTELMAIEPLLDEYDPALVAAAALHQRGVAEQPESETPSWTRVYVTVGRRDGTRPADLVGILVKVAGFRPNVIGRIDIRDSFSLIEVRPEDAEQAIRGLNGQTVRGRRVLARLDKK